MVGLGWKESHGGRVQGELELLSEAVFHGRSLEGLAIGTENAMMLGPPSPPKCSHSDSGGSSFPKSCPDFHIRDP